MTDRRLMRRPAKGSWVPAEAFDSVPPLAGRSPNLLPDPGEMWVCPGCGRSFASRGQTHTCQRLGELDAHFVDKDPLVRATFDRIVDAVQRLGPVTVLPEKTRVALHARMSFAAFTPRRHWLDGHVVLAERLDSPRFTKIETYSRRNVLHAFRLRGPAEVDAEVIDWLTRAYDVGRQRHLHER